MKTQHKIRAYLYENVLTKDNPNDYIARTASERSLNVQQICEMAVSRGGADVSASAMERATELFLKEMAYQLCDGYSINTDYFTARTKILGKFDSPDETFDTNKHGLIFNFNQGKKLKSEIPNIEINILGMADPISSISQITDLKSGSINDVLTPNRNLKIRGSKIKITGNDPGNGIFFVNTDSYKRTRAQSEDIAVNKPSELIIMVPDLPKGTYYLEVATQYTGSKKQLKEARTTRFDKILRVL